ncbi:MAG: nucleoside recognition domain-containing protein [Desulfuromusa sp.]|nr:nucleoside recognition domain-containing protein [Desulfuromusa sp.]
MVLTGFVGPGYSPEIFLEIPDYHVPHLGTLIKKLWMRIRGFVLEAIPLVLLGILFINILYLTGVIDVISEISTPLVVNLMGLPKEAVSSLIIGFLRKDVAVGMLEPLDLSIKQLIIACTVLAIYFPCIATFAVLIRELGGKDDALRQPDYDFLRDPGRWNYESFATGLPSVMHEGGEFCSELNQMEFSALTTQ